MKNWVTFAFISMFFAGFTDPSQNNGQCIPLKLT